VKQPVFSLIMCDIVLFGIIIMELKQLYSRCGHYNEVIIIHTSDNKCCFQFVLKFLWNLLSLFLKIMNSTICAVVTQKCFDTKWHYSLAGTLASFFPCEWPVINSSNSLFYRQILKSFVFIYYNITQHFYKIANSTRWLTH
jgi:hypothetical protein